MGARWTGTDKRGKSSNTSLRVELCLWGSTAARPEQSYLVQPGPSEDFLHHWHCDKGTHLIPVIVCHAVGNVADRMDFQHFDFRNNAAEAGGKKKTNTEEDARFDTITCRWPSCYKVTFYGKNTLPKHFLHNNRQRLKLQGELYCPYVFVSKFQVHKNIHSFLFYSR